MIVAILIVLGILWFLGFLPNNFLDIPLFVLFGKTITVYSLVIFGIILTVIGVLPGPFRQIASVLLLLWLLAIFGIISITFSSQVILGAIVLGLILYILRF